MNKPWMSDDEISTITKYLDKNGIMLEYGCGGSTVYFCDYVKKYYSIEHHPTWYHKMKAVAKENTKMFCVERDQITPEKDRIQPSSWNLLESSSRSKDFKNYIQFPQTFAQKFDFVLIDGRARPECAKFIYDYLKDGAIVFMHDYWNRKYYHVVEEKYKVIDAVKRGQSLVVLGKK